MAQFQVKNVCRDESVKNVIPSHWVQLESEGDVSQAHLHVSIVLRRYLIKQKH